MNAVWDNWKKGFDAWENATAKLFESVLKSPLVLEPAGSALTATMKAKTARDAAIAKAWAAMGLPTRRDQERILHSLNQIQSRLLDLEEKLEDAVPARAPRKTAPKAAPKAAPKSRAKAKSAPRKKGGLRLAADSDESP